MGMGALDCVGVRGMIGTESTEAIRGMPSNCTLNEPGRDLESQTSKAEGKGHSVWWKIGTDLPLFVLLCVLLGLFEFGVLGLPQAGFYCNDPALSFPFRGDTVTMSSLLIPIFMVPFVTIFTTELIFYHLDSQRSRVRYALDQTLRLYRAHTFGLILNFGIVEVMKGITGRPRPTFFDLCRPDAAASCNGTEFVSSFRCTSSYPLWMQSDSYHSFPSGHTSLSVHAALFTAWYLQRRAFSWRNRTIFVVPLLQLICGTFAAICSLTRITDHRHHWWDVLTGFVIGVASALYVVFGLCKNFSTKRKRTLVEPPTYYTQTNQVRM